MMLLHVPRVTIPFALRPLKGEQGFDKLSPNGDCHG